MKKITIGLMLGFLGISTAGFAAPAPDAQSDPNFEFWNKMEKPVWVVVRDHNSDAAGLTPWVKASDWVRVGADELYFPPRDINKSTEIVLYVEPTADQLKKNNQRVVYRYTINPGKTIYARIKPSKSEKGFEFGPQTGPWLGILGVNERGYSLSKNFKTYMLVEANANAQTDQLPGAKQQQSGPSLSLELRDAYAALGVMPTATNAEIRSAYKKVALKWHPDKWKQSSPENQKLAEQEFNKIVNYVDVIKKARGGSIEG